MTPPTSVHTASRGRLAIRLGVRLCLGAALILLAFGAWNLRLQRQHLTSLLEARAGQTAAVISGAAREAMLRNDPHEVRAILSSIAAQPDIDRIRVFDKRGTIKVSSELREVGQSVDIGAEQCLSCHRPEQLLTEPLRSERTRIFGTSERGRILGVIHPIRNEPSCSGIGCHESVEEKSVLGVLDVQLSLAHVESDLAASQRQLAFGLGGTVAAVVLLAAGLLWRSVVRPVNRLAEGTARVAEGDLSSRVPVTSDDELGALSQDWNTMVERLEEARRQLERWNITLAERVQEKTRELETAHQQMILVEKMASLGKLAAVVAHEINNPLAGIATYARLLRKRLAGGGGSALDAAETERILRMVEEESDRCGGIVRNLLLFSRTPGVHLSRQAVCPLLDRCVLLLGHQAELGEVALESSCSAELPEVECDPSQIQQMVLALTSNALEATEPGGHVKVSAEVEGDGRAIRIVVEDDGRGIPPEQVDRVFEPFFTTKEEASGVGLGLAVVYGIVQRHHGSIDLDSQPGRGTRVTVRLPLDQPHDHPQPAAAPAGGSR